jgi:hypothetical protein
MDKQLDQHKSSTKQKFHYDKKSSTTSFRGSKPIYDITKNMKKVINGTKHVITRVVESLECPPTGRITM